MNDEFDYELTRDQWEALKAVRSPASERAKVNRFTIESLVALDLVAMLDNFAAITPRGRKVLIRGSSQLLHDIAA